jgi:hypothetical protein
VPLPSLRPDRLTVFVFGPGTGELVAAHVPPGVWMFVDGCSAASRGYALQLLDHYGPTHVGLVVLTHPHLDHTRGLAELIDRATLGPPNEWPILAMAPPPLAVGAGRVSDPTAHYLGGVTEQAVAAILDRWERAPAVRWDLRPGSTRELGDAEVTSLSPDPAVRQLARASISASKRFDWNRMATVLSLEWEQHRVVFGSDLVERPGKGWTHVLRLRRDLNAHIGLKIAHHGSKEAQHKPLLVRPKKSEAERCWIATPFASSNLPRFGKGEGVDKLLRHASAVHLTALPQKYANQGGAAGVRMRRTELAKGSKVRRDPPTTGFPDCFVAAVFERGRPTPELVHGDGSVVVIP